MKKIVCAVAIACSSLWAFNAHAQFEKVEDAIDYRQAAFSLMASHFGRMAPVVKGQADYDAKSIKENVDLLKTLSKLPFTAFGEGTQGGNAKPGVWSEADKFKQKREKFEVAISELSVAADAGDLAKFKAAFGKVGQTCKSCHNDYLNR